MPSDLARSAARSRKQGAKIVKGLQDAFAAQPGGHQARLGAVVAKQPARYERDMQAGRVYQAEKRIMQILNNQHEHPLVEIAGSTIAVPLERKFADLSSIQIYCDATLNSMWPAYEQAIRSGVKVRARKGSDRAHYEQGGVIAIPVHDTGRWAMRGWVITHELAHHLVGAGHGHNEVWVRALLDVVGRQMGPEAELIAKVNFAECGVRQNVID